MFTNLFIVIPSRDPRAHHHRMDVRSRLSASSSVLVRVQCVRKSSLRTRDHIALDEIIHDRSKHVLPYLLSYVFMVFIMQVSPAFFRSFDFRPRTSGFHFPRHYLESGEGQQPFRTASGLRSSRRRSSSPWAFALYPINTSMEGVFNPRLRGDRWLCSIKF